MFPTSSCAFTTVLLDTFSTTSLATNCLNPDCLTVTVYVPGFSSTTTYSPAALAVTLRASSVPLLTIETEALGTRAPDLSVTTPLIVPVNFWPHKGSDRARQRNRTPKRSRIAILRNAALVDHRC